jgi:transcriptional regulator with XRE-family HTH domain
MNAGAGTPFNPDEPVGAALARLRRASGMTGTQLAAHVGMSQPKISRIERGVGNPDPTDVAALAGALGADKMLVHALMEQARRSHDKLTDWRSAPINLASSQDRIKGWEAAASVVLDFEPGMLSGLLQTSGYARAVLSSFQRVIQMSTEEWPATAIVEAVSARIRRQEVLVDPAKSFRFIFLETILKNYPCPPAEMLAQINHLRGINERHPNVTIGIIPDSTTLDIPPVHGFVLYDDELLVIDSFNTGLSSRGRTDLAQYRYVFDYFAEQAIADIDPLLDRYQELYLEQLRKPTRR